MKEKNSGATRKSKTSGKGQALRERSTRGTGRSATRRTKTTAAAMPSGSRKTKVAVKTEPMITPTTDHIATRAYEIWQEKGCMPGRDMENWLEAEAQLMQ